VIEIMSYTPHSSHGMQVSVSVYACEFCFHEVDYWLYGSTLVSDLSGLESWLKDNIKTSALAHAFAAMERSGGILQ